MKLLSISSDPKVLDPNSAVSKRLDLQRAQAEKFEVLVRRPNESKIAAAWRMVQEGRRGQWDVVMAQDPFWLGHIGWHIKQKTGAKLQIQVHTDLAAQPLWKRLFARINLGRADSVRVVSEQIKKSLEPLKLRAPIVVLPIFIDIEKVRAAVSADKAPYAKFSHIILIASRLEPEKNIVVTVEAMPQILHIFPHALLLIAGDGSQKSVLENLVKKLGIENNVIFLGHRSDVFGLYKIADVMLNPSKFEGYGASIVEALAAGTAVVSTDVGAAKEAGATIANEEEFAEKIIEVLKQNKKGELKLPVLTEEQWIQKWRESLPS